MIENPNPPQTTTNSDEIDFIEVIRHIWDGRWLIAKVTLAFIVLGLLIAFTTTPKYTAQALLLPEQPQAASSSSALLRQLGMGGSFTMGTTTDAISPFLYPEVLKSTDFFVALMYAPITVSLEEGNLETDVITYLLEYSKNFSLVNWILNYTIKLPWTIKSWFQKPVEAVSVGRTTTNNNRIRKLNRQEAEMLEHLQNHVSSSINDRNWIISISVESTEPFVAAQIADFTVNYLSDYISTYRTEKIKKDLEFIHERYYDKRKEFHDAQLALANFRDANRNVVSAIAQTEEQHLQNQYNIAFGVYNNLAQQLEQSRITVQEETPVIKVLEPVVVPVKRSKPRRGIILLIFTFLGGVTGVGIVFIKPLLKNIKEQLSL